MAELDIPSGFTLESGDIPEGFSVVTEQPQAPQRQSVMADILEAAASFPKEIVGGAKQFFSRPEAGGLAEKLVDLGVGRALGMPAGTEDLQKQLAHSALGAARVAGSTMAPVQVGLERGSGRALEALGVPPEYAEPISKGVGVAGTMGLH